MRVEFKAEKSVGPGAWQGRFGVPAEELATRLSANTLIPPHADSWMQATAVFDKGYRFDFKRRYTGQPSKGIYKQPETWPLKFSIIFDYKGDPHRMRFEDFFLTPCKGEGVGSALVAHLICNGALPYNVTHISLKPDMDGSSFWPRHGARIQHYPTRYLHPEFFDRLTMLLQNPDMRPGWNPRDITTLDHLSRNTDLDALHAIICRDDLTVIRHDGKQEGLHRFLLTNLGLDDCIFDLDSPWTRACLKQRSHINILTERRKLNAQRPVPAASANRAAYQAS